MTASKEKLIKIYQEAKKRRIVLNQAEFAKAVGLSRVHLFKKMQEIPEKVIGKALQLLETKNDLGKTINVTQGLPELVGERIELTAAMRAAIKILTLKCIEQDVIKGTAEAAEKLGIDQLQVKNVSRKYFKMIFEQCKGNPKFSANRQNVYRKWLKKLYDELIEMEAVEVNPLVFIRKEKIVKKKRVMPTDEQRQQISKYLKENYYNFWRAIQIFFASGSRETELMNVKIKDIDLKSQQCKYLVLKGKEAHEVNRPISDAVLYLWEELKGEDEDYLFSYDLKPGPNKLSTEALSKRWKRHVKKELGINVDLYSLKYLNTTEIMEILDDTKEAMKLTAHTTEAMIVKIYDTKNKQRKDDKIKKVGSTF